MGGCGEENQTLPKKHITRRTRDIGQTGRQELSTQCRKKRFSPQGHSNTGTGTQRGRGVSIFGDTEISVIQDPEHLNRTGRMPGLELWRPFQLLFFAKTSKVCIFPFTTGVFS